MHAKHALANRPQRGVREDLGPSDYEEPVEIVGLQKLNCLGIVDVADLVQGHCVVLSDFVQVDPPGLGAGQVIAKCHQHVEPTARLRDRLYARQSKLDTGHKSSAASHQYTGGGLMRYRKVIRKIRKSPTRLTPFAYSLSYWAFASTLMLS